MIQKTLRMIACVILATALPPPGRAQTSAELKNFFTNSIGLDPGEVASIDSGNAVTKVMPSRTPAEIFVFGAVYIKAPPESYARFATDFDRLRKLPQFLAIGKLCEPPRITDLDGFEFDSDDLQSLEQCRPRHCDVQMPAESIEDLHQSVKWDAPDVARQVNGQLHQRVIQGLQAYHRDGNAALGVYSDKETPVDVSKQFEYMLSDARVLPSYLPDFNRYLLAYPKVESANIEDTVYWAKVKFGLKPTLRIVQLVMFRGHSAKEPAYAIAEKQLYSSHYFETALDLTFCIRGNDNSMPPGFYLVKVMGSEQAGLTGVKGSIVRKVATGRSASALEQSLDAIKSLLENPAAK